MVIALYFFCQSSFVLGSTIWPKNAFLKTFVAGAIIFITYVLFILWMNDLFDIGTTLDRSLDKERVWITLAIVFSICALFNWTLAYFRLKESEIINRM